MKKSFIIILLVICISNTNIFSAGNKEQDQTTSENTERVGNLPDLKGRTIIAVTGNDYVPLNFVDPNTGKAIGFEYDLTNKIGELLNANIQWEVSSWETMISAVREGQFDVGMDGITITEERREQIDFSIPYVQSEQVMLVRYAEDRFTTPEEFASDDALLIGSQSGTTSFYTAVYDILDGNEQNPRIILLDTFALTVRALINGDVDLVIMDKVSALEYIGQSKDNQLKMVGDSIKSEKFGYIFTPKSDLVEPFNQAIEYLDSNNILSELEQKWFFEYFSNQ